MLYSLVRSKFDGNLLPGNDYVFFIDNCFDLSSFPIYAFLQKMEIYNLDLAQPATIAGGFWDNVFTIQKLWSEYRLCNRVYENCVVAKNLNKLKNLDLNSELPDNIRSAIIDSIPIARIFPTNKNQDKYKELKEKKDNNIPLCWESRKTSFVTINNLDLKIGAEIGVNFGAFSSLLLTHTNTSKLYSIDYWPNYKIQKIAEENLGKFGDRSKIIKTTSQKASQQFPDSFFDYIFIDANHNYFSVKSDLINWWPKLKIGGLFFGHDYISGKNYKHFGVIKAVDEFAESEKQDIRVLGTSSLDIDEKHHWSNWWKQNWQPIRQTDSKTYKKIDVFQCWWCLKKSIVKNYPGSSQHLSIL